MVSVADVVITGPAKPLNVDAYLVVVTFPDGCRLNINPHDNNPGGWKIIFLGGFIATCPHGETVDVIAGDRS